MCKKTLSVLLFGALSFLSSCVDNNYDLVNKEISTDVKLEGNKVALPVGSLKAVVLDSLIDVSEIEMLGKLDGGVYGITADSTISVEAGIDPITLDIAPVKYSIPVDFNKADIKNVQIDPVGVTMNISSQEISVDDLNGKLPTLQDSVKKCTFKIPGLENVLNKLDADGGSYTFPIPNPVSVSTGEREASCKFSYTLPVEIETIKSIRLGTSDDEKGILVNVLVTNPKPLEKSDKELNFRIDFPQNFKLAVNDNADQAGKYRLENDRHSIVLDGFVPEGENSLLSFYLTEITGVDGYINANGYLDIDQTIKYKIDYAVSGNVELYAGLAMEDFAFDVIVDAKLAFLDLEGSTKDINIDFKPIAMGFKGKFDNLQYIDTINHIVFDEAANRIGFTTRMDKGWLDVFSVGEDYELKISFPEALEINDALSEYDGKGNEIVYDSLEHAFFVKDFAVLADARWELVLQKLTLNAPVEGGKYTLDFSAGIDIVKSDGQGGYESVSSFVLAGRDMDSMVGALEKLNGEKSVAFAMEAAELKIAEAVVHTKAITSGLTQNTDFSINEEVPAEIGRIERIGFKDDVFVTMAMNVVGVEDLDADIDINASINLPSFLDLRPQEGSTGVAINDGVLDIDVKYNPSSGEPLKLELLCSGMDFTKEFGEKGLVPEVVDGAAYIKYDGVIDVNGEACINGARVSSTVLDREISFDVEFTIDEIAVKEFHGLYCAGIEGVNEKIDLDLGEELEFLREEGNSIVLADPQLEFVVRNPVGVPVDINLNIFGTDENGAPIADTEIVAQLSILPAEYDEVTGKLELVETKLFLTTDTAANSKAGYENVQIENLANLLKKIPHSINLNVEPVIKTAGVTHHVDISEPIKLDAAYSVIVPLKFNELHLCYTDSVAGLDSDMGETVGMFSNVSLSAKMDIVNTIPLGLSLKMVPYDIEGNLIEDIEIDELKIDAGGGEAILDENGVLCENLPSQNFSFSIKSKSGDVSALDKLVFQVEAASEHTVGSVALKGEQGIKLSNIVLEVEGDVEMDFGK